MEQMMETVRSLAKEIGPRPPTSAAEAQSAAYINAKMRQADLDVDVQTFRAVPTFGLPYGFLFTAFTFAPLVYWYLPPAALALCLVALIVFFAETLSFPLLSSWLPGGKSQNIIGTRPAAQEARQHLVVMAHMDSSRAALSFHPKLLPVFRRSFLLMVAAMISLPVLTGLGWLTGALWMWYAQWVPSGYLGITLLLILHREIFMPHVPGANDNASGVAVLLQLAEELDNLQHTNLWLIATGCEEAGMHGARNFLRQYPFPKKDTYLLNLDNIGQGQLSIIVEEGMLWAHRSDPLLVELAGQVDAADITIDAEPRTYHLMTTDAQVPLVRGFRAMSLMAFEDGLLPNWHWPTDTIDRIQPELLDRAAKLAEGIARRLDRRVTDAGGEGEELPSQDETVASKRPEPATPEEAEVSTYAEAPGEEEIPPGEAAAEPELPSESAVVKEEELPASASVPGQEEPPSEPEASPSPRPLPKQQGNRPKRKSRSTDNCSKEGP